ncbi:MAG: hypothetical protein ACRDGH_05855 [Candidatus Limnocylindria bacterium]
MSFTRSLTCSLLGVGVVLLGTTGAASAQNATLYEVSEMSAPRRDRDRDDD